VTARRKRWEVVDRRGRRVHLCRTRRWARDYAAMWTRDAIEGGPFRVRDRGMP